MSYHRTRPRVYSYPVRASLGGVSSQAPGKRIMQGALVPMAGVSSQPPGLPVANRAMISMGSAGGRGSLGADDTSITSPTLVDPTRAYQERSIKLQEQLIEAQRHWAEGDKMQKWIQIAATIMIPVSAAIWKAIGVGRRKPT